MHKVPTDRDNADEESSEEGDKVVSDGDVEGIACGDWDSDQEGAAGKRKGKAAAVGETDAAAGLSLLQKLNVKHHLAVADAEDGG